MNLKETFQAQNRISELLAFVGRYLSDKDNVMTVMEKHLRSKALSGQQDETIDVSGENRLIIEELLEALLKSGFFSHLNRGRDRRKSGSGADEL